MQRRLPIGFDTALLRMGGVAPYAAARLPGPLTAAMPGDGIGEHDSLSGSEAEPGSVASRPFDVDGNFYRVRRVDIDQRYSYNETPLPPEQAQRC